MSSFWFPLVPISSLKFPMNIHKLFTTVYKGERSCVFRAIFRSFAMMIRGRMASFDAIFVMVTSIHGRDYHFNMMRGLDSELNGRDHRAAWKNRF